jgi:hypothetical protein
MIIMIVVYSKVLFRCIQKQNSEYGLVRKYQCHTITRFTSTCHSVSINVIITRYTCKYQCQSHWHGQSYESYPGCGSSESEWRRMITWITLKIVLNL